MLEGTRSAYWLTFGVIAALIAGYAYKHDLQGRYMDYLESKHKVEEMRVQRDELKAQHDTLMRQAEDLEGDPVEIEASIRLNSNKVRRGERIYRIELPEESGQGVESPASRLTPPEHGVSHQP